MKLILEKETDKEVEEAIIEEAKKEACAIVRKEMRRIFSEELEKIVVGVMSDFTEADYERLIKSIMKEILTEDMERREALKGGK